MEHDTLWDWSGRIAALELERVRVQSQPPKQASHALTLSEADIQRIYARLKRHMQDDDQ